LAALTVQPPGSTPILPITGGHSLFPPSSTHRPIGLPCGSLSRVTVTTGRPMGLPRFVQVPAQVRFRLSAGGSTSAMGELGAPILDPLPFGPSLYALVGQVSTFGLFSLTTFISGSLMLTILRNPSPRPPWCWQSQLPLAVPLPSLAFDRHIELVGMRNTLVPGASHPTVTSDACPGRIPVAEDRVASCRIPVSFA
jgi:hypothetical protein